VADDGDPELFEIFRRQVRQNIAVDFVFAKSCLVLAQPEATKPSPNVHYRFLASPARSSSRWNSVSSSLSDWGFDLREAPSVLSQIVE
jgi:hypothetical protein